MFMAPLIKAENIQLEGKRLQLLRLHEGVQKGKTLSDYDKEWLRNLSQEYRVPTAASSMDALFQELLIRVDTVPPSWLWPKRPSSRLGQSRFAYCGNNLFGKYCFTPGCGIVAGWAAPKANVRSSRLSHSYSRSALVHPKSQCPSRLSSIPRVALQKRAGRARPDGHTLALGLQKYAETGMAYVAKIRTVISQNKRLMALADFSELGFATAEISARGRANR